MTSLRGIAAVLVVINHASLLMLPLGLTRARPALIKTGILGMTIFFVLSGFVMYYNYAHRITTERREGTLHFAAARFARLYPLLLAYVLLNFALNVGRALVRGHSTEASIYVATLPLYLLGIQSWLYAVIGNTNVTISQALGNPAWSVSTELFFYMLFVPLIIMRKASTPSISRGIVIVIASITARGLFLLAAGTSVLQHWIAMKFGESPLLNVYEWLVYYCPYGRCFEFLAGIGIGEIWLARRQNLCSPALDFFGKTAGVCGLAYIGASFVSEIGFSIPWLFEGAAMHFFYIIAVPPAIYLMSRERGLGAKFLSLAPLLLLGEISYSLYFVHTLVFPMFRVSPETDIAQHLPSVAGRCAAFTAITLSVSTLVYRLYEKPARAALSRVLGIGQRPIEPRPASGKPLSGVVRP
ncbi:acyltransferase family protein [Trinickia dabaoshanensis]|uniref:acyltransferase family protein n=1 Tax=Trinickia dabaoshanensis TaxID=564714 RepID=UPI0013049A4F|nr:acyltransferase [Trinickia dabaoshanensis]